MYIIEICVVSRTIFRIVLLRRDTLLINPCHVPEYSCLLNELTYVSCVIYLCLANELTYQLCDSSSSFLTVLCSMYICICSVS